jgi:hypothetical protein
MGDPGNEIEFQAGTRGHSLFQVVRTGFGTIPAPYSVPTEDASGFFRGKAA